MFFNWVFCFYNNLLCLDCQFFMNFILINGIKLFWYYFGLRVKQFPSLYKKKFLLNLLGIKLFLIVLYLGNWYVVYFVTKDYIFLFFFQWKDTTNYTPMCALPHLALVLEYFIFLIFIKILIYLSVKKIYVYVVTLFLQWYTKTYYRASPIYYGA
jgi:hypothetical protein